MPAHSQIAAAIEKNDSRDARLVNGNTEQGADKRIRATRIIHDRAAKVVMIISEALETIGERIVAELRPAADDHARRLATRV
jgi:hypothetical protein